MPEIVQTSELNVKMPQILRHSQFVETIFGLNFGFLQKKVFHWQRRFIFPFYVVLQKKGHRSERSANILVFYWICAVNNGVVPQTAAAYGFRQEIKTLVFCTRKNARLRKNSVRNCRKKFCIFCIFLCL